MRLQGVGRIMAAAPGASRRLLHAALAGAALILVGSAAVAAPATRPAHATATGTEQNGYGSIVLSFDELPDYKIHIRNNILIASFGQPVEVDVKPVAAGAPNFITLGRVDPDLRAVRFGLRQDIKLHVLQGGDKLFIDLLPEDWVGLPPGLPADVLADMNRRLRALDRARRLAQDRAEADLKPLTITAGSHAGLLRVNFNLGQAVAAHFARAGDEASVTVDAPLPFDVGVARAMLPPAITGLSAKVTAGRLAIRFHAPSEWATRSYREGETLVVDFFTDPAKAESAPAAPGLKVAPLPAPIEAPLSGQQRRGAPHDPPTTGSTPSRGAVPLPSPRLLHRTVAGAAPLMVAPAVFRPAPATAEDSTAPIAVPAPADPRPAPAAAVDAAPVRPTLHMDGTTLAITFPMAGPPPAAVFSRGPFLWVVLDSPDRLDATALATASGGAIARARTVPTDHGQALLLRLSSPRLDSLTVQDGHWVLALGDNVIAPSAPIRLEPGFSANGRAIMAASVGKAGSVHWLTDPMAGDRIAVATLPPPVRGMVQPRRFVDFQALATTQGVAVVPRADDVAVQVADGRLAVTRDGGLTLSTDEAPTPAITVAGPPRPDAPVFDAATWHRIRELPELTGARELIAAAAEAAPAEQPAALVRLARFHLAHGDASAAEGALELARTESPALAHDPETLLLQGAAQVELRRYTDAVRTLSAGPLATNPEAALWRGLAQRHLGSISAAREALRQGRPALGSMPTALQIRFRDAAVRAALAVRDFAAAAAELDAADALHQSAERFSRAVLRGEVDEGLGRPGAALDAYRRAINGTDPIAAAAATLAATKLRRTRGEITLDGAINAMADLTAMWRGDEIEAGALGFLAHLYREDRRWRDAFGTLRVAVRNYPDDQAIRDAQDEMGHAFSALFLDDGAKAAPPTLESLALFYDYKELMPTGARGDEMVRRLADRLVEVDLLDKAGALLDYQVEHRLSGVERAKVAARAAFIHLLDHKPGTAEHILQISRIAGLPPDLVRGRLLLEARALSELSRPDLALELVEGYHGKDVERLRADILWEARRWQHAGEALELLAGDSWKSPAPLPDDTLTDVLRAAIAYALADDPIGLDRVRAKFAAKMSAGPDGPAFDAVTAPIQSRGSAFQEVERAVSQIDTMAAFLESYRKRYPSTVGPMPAPEATAPDAPARTRAANPIPADHPPA